MFAANFPAYAEMFDIVRLYDNNSQAMKKGEVAMNPQLIARKERKEEELTVIDELAYKAFLRVATINIDATGRDDLYPPIDSTTTTTTTTIPATTSTTTSPPIVHSIFSS